MAGVPGIDALIGQRVGRDGIYLVQKRLGHGGFGEVYLAVDEKADRKVAIKFLIGEGADGITKERFRREAEKYGLMVRHPNLVRVLSFGNRRGRWFIVSEFVEGRTLAEILDHDGAFAVDEALRVTREVAVGLAAAHHANVVHRDLKPSNVMIRTADRAVKILDFGVAKDLLSSVGMRTGGFIGTRGYASPEQLKNEQIDHRTDIFALGAILYELLTHRFAFPGRKDAEIEKATRTLDPIPPSRFNEEVTAPIASLIERMLAKRPHRRPADMNEVIARIDAIQAGVLRTTAAEDEERRTLGSLLRKLLGW